MNDTAARRGELTNNLEAFWMPFTANRQFKAHPRLLAGAKDMHYQTADGRRILDGTAGLWCVNAGHGRREIADAVHQQAVKLDYAPAFQIGHPLAFEAAAKLATLLPGVDHLPHTHSLEKNAFTRGEPGWGAHLADDLERLVQLHDASTIAAVIVEPVAGSTGVLVPPKGYLRRLREICDRHGILLIFDEVITGFGRLGASFATEYFGVVPDLVTLAKGLSNGTVPMGAVAARKRIYDAFMQGPENAIELFHGYTYSGHPLAAAAALATLEIYAREGLFQRAKALSAYWEDAVHSLKGVPTVIDLRNLGIIAGIELEPIPGKPTARAFDVFLKCYERGLLIRTTGDIIALSPPLIVEKSHIDEMFGTLADAIKQAA